MAAIAVLARETDNPLDTVEELASAHDWLIDRSGSDEVTMVVEGSWSSLHLCLNWHEDLEGLHLACSFDLKVPPARREQVARLIALINEQLYFGHFDLWQQQGTLMFRHGLLLSGGAAANVAQCETLIRLALEACERYFPAFQFAIWAGKTAEEAIESTLLQTQGEA
jgi:hypothetical protein